MHDPLIIGLALRLLVGLGYPLEPIPESIGCILLWGYLLPLVVSDDTLRSALISTLVHYLQDSILHLYCIREYFTTSRDGLRWCYEGEDEWDLFLLRLRDLLLFL
jgi:hypothetical protein